MSQVTRCPSCETRFKVVADQLRISQGWVRCGVCQSVFDACEDLQAWDESALPTPLDGLEVQPQQHGAEAQAMACVQPNGQMDAIENIASSTDEAKAPSGFEFAPMRTEANQPEVAIPDEFLAALPEASAEMSMPEVFAATNAAAQMQHTKELSASELVDQPQATSVAADTGIEDVIGEATNKDAAAAVLAHKPAKVELSDERDAADAVIAQNAPADTDPSLNAAEPGFVRQARRQAFWHSAVMRVVLLLGSLLAVAALAAQYTWQQRDAVAALYPEWRPALSVLCKAAGCQLNPRREIADVVISSSGFTRLAAANQYQWSLSLANRSEVTVAMPMAELTLTDALDKPLLRRVIDLQALQAPLQLRPGQEWSVSIAVQVQELSAPVAGYRALVFYP